MSSPPVQLIVEAAPIVLPADLGLTREPPRPIEARQADYAERFDYTTLLYDVFKYRDHVIGVGPPLLNLAPNASKFAYLLDGKRQYVTFRDMNRVSRWRLEGSRGRLPYMFGSKKPLSERSFFGLRKYLEGFEKPQTIVPGTADAPTEGASCSRLSVSFARDMQAHASIGRNFAHLFTNRRCLLTKSKNNEIRWIRDWAKFHVEVHGADAVLFYDNGSDRYKPQDVLDALASVSGLAVAIVVDWRFKWGPHGQESGIWDSDFAQHGVLEHARWRFLEHARSVLYQDVDELAISDRSVFEIAETSSCGAIVYDGIWIENVAENSIEIAGRKPVHADFRYFDPAKPRASTKWCTVPRRNHRGKQWRVHWVSPAEDTKEVQLAHFKGVTTGWKHARPAEEFNPQAHREFEKLAALLAKAGLNSDQD